MATRPRTSKRAATGSPVAMTPGPGSAPERELATVIGWLRLPEPVREYRFTPLRRWRFDFAWPALLIAVEVEGGHWVGGHGGERFGQDCEKYNMATIAGWRVLRVTPEQITSGEAIEWLQRLLKS